MLIQYCFTIIVTIILLPVAHALPEPLVIFIVASAVMFIVFIGCGIGAYFFCRGRMGYPGWSAHGQRNYDPVAMSVLSQTAMQQQRGYPNSPYQSPTMYPNQQYPQYQQQYPMGIQPQAPYSKLPESQSFQTEPQPPIPPRNHPYSVNEQINPYPPANEPGNLPNEQSNPYPPTQTYANTGSYQPTAPPTASEVLPPTYSAATTQEKKY